MKRMSLLLLSALSLSLSAADSFLPKSFSAKFEQVTVSIVSGKEKISSGNLDYLFPSNLRLNIEQPDPLLLVSNKQKTWFYRPPFIEGEREELTVKDSGKTELTQFFDILQYGLLDNPFYRVIKSPAAVELAFSEKGKKTVGVEKALLYFSSGQSFSLLKNIKVTQNAHKNFELRFKSIEINPSFPADHFVFTKPPSKKD